MSAILALGITYALIATDNSMYKGPRRAAQLCCTRQIFTAVAPRSIERLLNTRRTLSIVSQSDGFRYVRECGFYEDCDDDFCLETLKKIDYLQKVYFSRGCLISAKTGDYLLQVASLREVAMYMEDEHFPVDVILKLLKFHRAESVRASVANTIVIHEQENRGKNTRTLMELRRLGADKILFDLIESPVDDVECLTKYAGALGALCLSWTRVDLANPQFTLPAAVASDREFLAKISRDGTAASRLTPSYVVGNIIPIYKFLSHCGESGAVRGAAHCMLGSCTARGEFADVCEEVFTPTFFEEELLPMMKARLKPFSPEAALDFNGVDWIGMRNEVITNSMSVTASFSRSPSFSPTPSRNRGQEEHEKQAQVYVSVVPSVEERELAKNIMKRQTELSYFTWVLQNCAQSKNSREVLLSVAVLEVLGEFLTVFKTPAASTKKMKKTKSENNIDDDNEDDHLLPLQQQQQKHKKFANGNDIEDHNNNACDDDDDEHDDDGDDDENEGEEDDVTLLKKEDTAYTYSRLHPERCDVAAYAYSIEARHRIFDTLRYCVGQERISSLTPLTPGPLITAQVCAQRLEEGRDAIAKLTQKLISTGVLQKLLDNVEAGPGKFRSATTYLELVVAVARFVPSVASDTYDLESARRRQEARARNERENNVYFLNSEQNNETEKKFSWNRFAELREEEIKTLWMILRETSFLKSFMLFFLNSEKYWTKLMYENRIVKEYKENGKRRKRSGENNNNNEDYSSDEEHDKGNNDDEERDEEDEEESDEDGDDDDDDYGRKLDAQKISDAQKRVKKHLGQIRKLKEELLHCIPTCLNVLIHLSSFLVHHAFAEKNSNASAFAHQNSNIQEISSIWNKIMSLGVVRIGKKKSMMNMKHLTEILSQNSFEISFANSNSTANNKSNWWNEAALRAAQVVNDIKATTTNFLSSNNKNKDDEKLLLLDTFFGNDQNVDADELRKAQHETRLMTLKKKMFFWNRLPEEMSSSEFYAHLGGTHLGGWNIHQYRAAENRKKVTEKYELVKELVKTLTPLFENNTEIR